MTTAKQKIFLTQPLRIAQEDRREKNRVNTRKREKKRGPKPIIFSDELKASAVLYVIDSGYWKTRLSKFLRVSVDTLDRRLKQDKKFAGDLEAAEAEFIRNNIKSAKPEFILSHKYRDEFPENNFDPGIGDGGEALEAVILRIRKILPASGQ